MPSPTLIPLTPPSLPPGYCFTSWAQLAIDLFTGAFGTFPGNLGTGYNNGSAIPAVNDANKPWVRLNASGAIIGTYTFAFGRWVMPHPTPPGPNDLKIIWEGTLGDLYLFDGGDGTDPSIVPPTNITGTFWEVDTNYEFRVPVGVGKFPISGIQTAVGDIGGLDKVSLSTQEMPPHTHIPQAEGQTGKPGNRIWGTDANGDSSGAVYPNNHGLANTGTSEIPINTTLKDAGGDTSVTPVIVKPHENLPPYRAVYICKRTIRAYYTV